MTISVKKNYNIHLFTFLLLSLFFIFSPIPFINEFIAVAICLGVLSHIRKIEFRFNKWYDTIIFIIINIYLTFAFFGYDLFLSHPKIPSPYFYILYFGLAFLWTSYILQSALDLIAYISKIKNRVCMPSLNSYWKKWLVLFIIMSALFSLWQIAYNPITIFPDSYAYINGWLFNSYDAYRSPIYSFLINIICNIAPVKPELLWVGVAQNLAFSALLASILMYFHMKWIRFRYIIICAVILPLIPSFGLHTIFVSSDLATGLSILWLTYILVRIIDEVILHTTASETQQISFCIQLCMALIFTYFIRQNSFLVYLIMIPVLAIIFIIFKQYKFLFSCIFSTIIVLLILFPGYNYINVNKSEISKKIKYYAGIHDIQATYYAGGTLSEQTMTNLRKHIPELDNPNVSFRPDSVEFHEWKYAYDLSDLTLHSFMKMYIDSFIHNPADMLKSMLHRVHIYWAIDPKGEVYFINYTAIYDTTTMDYSAQSPDINIYRNPNFLTKIMDKYIEVMVQPVPATFIWRYGIWTALILITSYALFNKKQFIWLLVIIPVLTYLVTLYLTSGWIEYRYGLSVLFTGMFLPSAMVLLAPADINSRDNNI